MEMDQLFIQEELPPGRTPRGLPFHPAPFQVKSVLLKLGKNSVLVLYRCKVLLEQEGTSTKYKIVDKIKKIKDKILNKIKNKITGGNETANDISKEVEIFPANTTCTIPPFPDPGKLSSCY